MKTELSKTHLEAWRRYYPSFWRVYAAIEADLAAAGLPSLSWYDALYELYLAPERRLRMSELARSALLSRSGLTRLVDRLEQEGVIERKKCPSDGRAQHAQLTGKGVAVLLNCGESAGELLAQFEGTARPAQAPERGRMDLRSYGVGAQVLRECGVQKMQLMGTPRRMPSMAAGYGLEIAGYITKE